ncbi:MAG: hypothetical protein HQK83_09370 [Fibrobacteria bacterium]|nr:hypothetical protein [Fibrobacteria bacterium]
MRYILLSFLTLFFTIGCVHHRSFLKTDYKPAAVGLVVVYPFENLSTHPGGGDITTANFITELRSTTAFSILDASFLAQKKIEIEGESLEKIEVSQLSLEEKIKQAAAANADAIITGKVTEFKYKKGLGEEPVVGLNVQMIQLKTREVIWSASISVTGGFMSWSEQSLNNYSQKAVKHLVCGLKK